MKRKKNVVVSLGMALGVLVFSYWVTNLRIPVSGERAVLSELELIRSFVCPHKAKVIDSVLFVNVAYDKVMSPAKDEYDMPAGHKPITDRGKLIKLLRHLQKEDTYRYILLDVFFGDDFKTEYDEELYGLIDSMPRIVIPAHEDERLADERLEKKAGLADYTTTFFKPSFVKFPFFVDSVPSVALKMYEDITHRTIRKRGFLYTDGIRLARNSIVLTFDLRADQTYADNGEKIWYNLGMDLLADTIKDFHATGEGQLYKNAALTQDKYIVIGSFDDEDDAHSTFVGKTAGSVILFNAFVSLMNGHHLVSIPLVCFLLLVFFVMSYSIVSGRSSFEILRVSSYIQKDRRLGFLYGAMSFLGTWVKYSLVMTATCIATYYTLGEVYDIFITSTVFALIKSTINRINKIKNRQS